MPQMGYHFCPKDEKLLRFLVWKTSKTPSHADNSFHQDLLEKLIEEEGGESSQEEKAAVNLHQKALKLLHKAIKLLEGKIGHKRPPDDENQRVHPIMGKVTVSKAVAELLGTSAQFDTTRDIIVASWMGKGPESHTSQDGNEGVAGGEAAHQHGRYGTVGSWMGKGLDSHTWQDGNEGAAGGEAAHQHGRYGTVGSWMGKGHESHTWQGWKWRSWRGRSC